MANIGITSTTNSVTISAGVYFIELSFIKKTTLKNNIDSVNLNQNCIDLKMVDGSKYSFQFETNEQNKMIVDSVNDITPTSLSHLFDLINTVIA